jgi:UDP-N-acetylmuramoyl-tripeptide--D-alanyl-D-alanine ligase
MRELGESGPAYHREIGDALVEYGVNEVLAVGELARNYLEAGARGRWAPNVEEALQELDDLVRPGDAVLVKGSLAVGLEAVAEALTKVPSR